MVSIACAPAPCQAEGKGAHCTQPCCHHLVQAKAKKNPDQKITSTVQNEADVSDPLIFNETIVMDWDIALFKACNLQTRLETFHLVQLFPFKCRME